MDHGGPSTQRTLLSWADDGLREFPWRARSRSFYEVFLAEFLLTQTPAENVADVYPELCDRYPDLDGLAAASESELESALEPLGFQRMRAAALSEIAATHDSLPPDGERARTYNLALLDFGATVCTKREPACSSCPLRERCAYVTHRGSGEDNS